MRSIASQSDVGAYIDACVDELNTAMKGVEEARDMRDEKALFEQVHRLKNVFMSGTFAAGADVCSRVMDALRVHEIESEGIALLVAITEEAIDVLRQEPEFGKHQH
jgi:hypothetical protein